MTSCTFAPADDAGVSFMVSRLYVVTVAVVPLYFGTTPLRITVVPLMLFIGNHPSEPSCSVELFEIRLERVRLSADDEFLQARILSMRIVTVPGSLAAFRAMDCIEEPSVPPVSTVTICHTFVPGIAGIAMVFTGVAPAVSEQRVNVKTLAETAALLRIQKLTCLYPEKFIADPSALYAIFPVVNPAAIAADEESVPSWRVDDVVQVTFADAVHAPEQS